MDGISSPPRRTVAHGGPWFVWLVLCVLAVVVPHVIEFGSPGILGRNLFLLHGSAAVFVGFFAVRLRYPRTQSTMELEGRAESVYFLAYVTTLVGFTLLGVRCAGVEHASADSLLNHPERILAEGGLNLLATLVGIIAMQVLRGDARLAAERERAEAGRVEERKDDAWQKALLKALESMPHSMAATEDARLTTVTTQVMERLRDSESERLKRLEEILHNPRVEGLALDVARQLGSVRESFEAIQVTAAKVSGVLPPLTERLASVNTSLAKLESVGQKLEEQLPVLEQRTTAEEAYAKELQDAARSLGDFCTKLQAGADQAKAFADGAKPLQEKLVQALDALSRGSHDLQRLHDTTAAFATLAQQLATPIRQTVENFTEVQGLRANLEALRSAVSTLAQTSQTAADSLLPLIAAPKKVGDEFERCQIQIAENLAKIGTAVAARPDLEKLVAEMRLALEPAKELATDLRAVSGSLQGLAGAADAEKATLQGLGKTAAELSSSFETAKGRSESLKGEVGELHAVLDKWVKTLEDLSLQPRAETARQQKR